MQRLTVERPGDRLPRARLRRAATSLFVPVHAARAWSSRYAAEEGARAGAAPARLAALAEDQGAGQEGDPGHGRASCSRTYAARKALPGLRLHARHGVAARARGLVPLRGDARPARAPIEEVKRDMEDAAPDGPPGLRRRRLRQDRGGDPRRVQGGAGRPAGGGAGADHHPGAAALRHLPRAARRLPGEGRGAVALPHAASEQKAVVAELGRRRGRHRHRHAPRCCRRTCASTTSAWWSSTRSSASASRTRSGCARCARNVDVLTLTATPIPRTLNLALAGARDMSLIETPPRDRLPVHTEIVEFDDERDRRRAAARDRPRRAGVLRPQPRRDHRHHGGAAGRSSLVPQVRIGVAHGQMRERELEQVMLEFLERRFDVLVSTMIIESGLDIPNVNTLIVDRADTFGLAQLYQLRGRVGRSNARAPTPTSWCRRGGCSPRRPRSACKRHRGVRRARRRLQDRAQGPGDPRRRQPARPRAARLHRSGSASTST